MKRLISLTLVSLIGVSCSSESTSSEITTTVAPETTQAEPEKVKIPDLTLVDRRVAMNTLIDLGLRVELQERMSNDDEGTIVGSAPSFGKSVEPGSRVVLYYAIPMVYELRIKFDINDGLAKNLGDGKCNYPKLKVQTDQSFVILGPEGQQLGSAPVPELAWQLDDPKVCSVTFAVGGLPEVATYRLQTGDGSVFPSVSFEQLKQNGWGWNWFWGRT